VVADLNVLGLNTVLDAAKGSITGRPSADRVKVPRTRGAKSG
jgi:hypothetical protein